MATSSSSSSAKKVAKLAQKNKGKKVRFQGGTLFPAIVVVILVLGLSTIAYARQSRPDPGSFPPQVGDHWHAAYGMYVCDGWLPKLTGNAEETLTDSSGNQSYVNDLYGTAGVHSHDDGVIHWHPFTTKSVGKRAKLGLFLDIYDIGLSTDELSLPAAQGDTTYNTDDFKCDGDDVEIKVVAWNSYTDTGPGTNYITDLDDVRLTNDGMVFAVAVVAAGTEVAMPPWASDLPELGAADGGNVPTGSTVEGQTGSTTLSTTGSSTDTSTGSSTGSSEPDSSAPTPTSTPATATTGG